MKSIYLGTALLGIITFGCSGSSTNTQGSGGSIALGGAQPGGGAGNTGGASATGGASIAGASTGGAPVATGGSGAGGTTLAAGGQATGGSNTGGQATGGKSSTAGTSAGGQATGGKSASGGTSAAGTATGGKSSSGGTSATGGQATGGKSAGGSTSAGGTATGGKTSAGGTNATGGEATGGGTGADTGKSAGCGKTSTITSSQYNNGNPISITVNGSQRRYILNVPTNYDNTKPYKFILGIHALNSNDKSVYSEKYYDLLPLSNNTVIFAAPNGVQSSGTPCSGTGSGDSGCGWPAGNNNIQLMDAVVKQVTDNFCVDMNHIYATGWSYGASMSYEVGCERPLGGPTATATWGVRAIALYAVAQMSGSCNPSTSYPVAMYLSHGTHDSVLGYDGGISLAQKWSNADACTWQTPTKVTSGNHVCTKMAGCKAGYPVEVCSFNGDHTAYPDNGTESSSWGPQEVWTFLSQF